MENNVKSEESQVGKSGVEKNVISKESQVRKSDFEIKWRRILESKYTR